MKLLTRLKILLLSSISEDRLIFELKKENDSLKLDVKYLNLTVEQLKMKIQELKNGFNFKFYDSNLQEKIMEYLSEAKEEVNIAVAWFTSDCLIEKIQELKNRGIKINVIISSDKSNIKKQSKLIEASNTFKIIDISKRKGRSSRNIMHNKYCVIDNYTVIDGSYNWSNNARYNEEHIIVVQSKLVADMYKANFYRVIDGENCENNIISLVS